MKAQTKPIRMDIDAGLHLKLKIKAATKEITMTEAVEEAIAMWVKEKREG